jgi:hypothetical protein
MLISQRAGSCGRFIVLFYYSSSEDLDKYWNQGLQQPNQDQDPTPKYICPY